jgi:Cu(I)-responsive transcriptional regulator
MNIGAAARQSELPAKTIRYYEEIGLVAPDRAGNGYRDYGSDDIHKLRFIQRARSLGFSIDECRQLMALYEDRSRASRDVKALALAKLADIDRKLEELQSMRHTLHDLATKCQGSDRPDCPILNDLAGSNRPEREAS